MTEKKFDTGVVSWQIFDEMFESQLDFIRKLRFLVRAGMVENDGVVLEIMADLLKMKESAVRQLREQGLVQREAAGGPGVSVVAEKSDDSHRAELLDPEDQRLLEKISEIRKQGGYHWENLRAVIEGAYHLFRSQKEHPSA